MARFFRGQVPGCSPAVRCMEPSALLPCSGSVGTGGLEGQGGGTGSAPPAHRLGSAASQDCRVRTSAAEAQPKLPPTRLIPNFEPRTRLLYLQRAMRPPAVPDPLGFGVRPVPAIRLSGSAISSKLFHLERRRTLFRASMRPEQRCLPVLQRDTGESKVELFDQLFQNVTHTLLRFS